MTDAPQRPESPAPPDAAVSAEQLQRAEHYIEEEEGATSRYRGVLATVTATLLVGSPQTVADQMNSFAANGVDAILLTFPDFVEDLDYFGRNVLPQLERDPTVV